MRFAEPNLLWGLFLIPLLLLWFASIERRRGRDLARWVAPAVWPDLNAELSGGRRKVSMILVTVSFLFLLLGAARPQFGSRVLETRQKGIDVVLAVDISLSMEARDVLPTRRGRALQETLALLDLLEGDRVALVSFAGEAFLQSPLTLDRGAIRLLLPLLDPDQVAEPGTNLQAAIERSLEAFQPDPSRGRAIILLTDGESHDGQLDRAIQKATEEKARICAIGIGKSDGEPIPLMGGDATTQEYKKDRHGHVVVTRLDEEPLREICQRTGGTYTRAEAGSASPRVYEALRALKQGELEGGVGVRYEERYAYFAALALLLLLFEGILGERRRVR